MFETSVFLVLDRKVEIRVSSTHQSLFDYKFPQFNATIVSLTRFRWMEEFTQYS